MALQTLIILLQRGTTCLSQEHPEGYESASSTQVKERLGRVELLLEKLVAKVMPCEAEGNAAKIATPESISCYDVLSPYKSSATLHSAETAPILSLFDNDMVSGNCALHDKPAVKNLDWPSRRQFPVKHYHTFK